MIRRPLALAIAVFTLGACYDSDPDIYMPQESEPDLVGVVQQIRHDTSFAPAGFQLDQYEIFIAIAPATTANAGIVLGPHTTALRSRHGKLKEIARESIAIGDQLEIWIDGGPYYESVQSPPGAPAYTASQVVLRP